MKSLKFNKWYGLIWFNNAPSLLSIRISSSYYFKRLFILSAFLPVFSLISKGKGEFLPERKHTKSNIYYPSASITFSGNECNVYVYKNEFNHFAEYSLFLTTRSYGIGV